MMTVLERLLQEDFFYWDNLCAEYEKINRSLKVPSVDKTALHEFNAKVEEYYTRAVYDYGRACRNKDAITRLIKNVLDDYYQGPNDRARKAAGIQFAQRFPAPEFYPEETVNLFDLEDKFLGYYYSMKATVMSLEAKAGAKITNNSLLNIETTIV